MAPRAIVSLPFVAFLTIYGVACMKSNKLDHELLLLEKINLLENKMLSLENELQQMKQSEQRRFDTRRAVPTGAIAFSAHRLHDERLAADQTIVFDGIETNVGQGYSSQQGTFTCPISGIYFFTVNILSHVNHLLKAYIMHAGKPVAGLFTIGASASIDDQSTASVVISCMEGQEVWVKSLDNYLLNGEVIGYTQFTGFLVAAADPSQIVG